MLSQAWTYHRRFKKDPLSVKLVVSCDLDYRTGLFLTSPSFPSGSCRGVGALLITVRPFLDEATRVLNTVSMFFVGHAAWYYLVTTGPRKRAVW